MWRVGRGTEPPAVAVGGVRHPEIDRERARSPGTHVTSIAPLRSAALAYAGASPSPVPRPTFLVVENPPKTRASIFPSIPQPPSSTLMRTYRPGANVPASAQSAQTSNGVIATRNAPPAVIIIVVHATASRPWALTYAVRAVAQRARSAWSMLPLASAVTVTFVMKPGARLVSNMDWCETYRPQERGRPLFHV